MEMYRYCCLSIVCFLLIEIYSSGYYVTALDDTNCSGLEPLDSSKFVFEYNVTNIDGQWVVLYDIRWQPVDLERPFRGDGRCSGDHRAPNGDRAECDSTGIDGGPCCSYSQWCGDSPHHCECPGCIDYRKKAFRDDSRCHEFFAPNGYYAECDPFGAAPCCSEFGWCGSGSGYCECEYCRDYREQFFHIELLFDDDGDTFKSWDSSSCVTDDLEFNTNIPRLVAKAPFTHQGLLQVAYVRASERLSPLPNISRISIIFRTPDCYAETKDAEFCDSQSVVLCGQPRDVNLVSASRKNDVVLAKFQWVAPVQVNDLFQIHSYGAQIHSTEGDLITNETLVANEEITTWLTGEDDQGLKDNIEYNLTVTPYVQQKLSPSSTPIAGRIVAHPFVIELSEATTLFSPTNDTVVLIPTEPLMERGVDILTMILVLILLGAALLVCCLFLICRRRRRRRKRRRSMQDGTFQNLEMFAKNVEDHVREVDELLKHKEIPHDHVTIDHKLGEGEFGVVHKGLVMVEEKGKNMQKEVAIKTTKVGACYDAREDLLNEMKLIAALGDHPNILHLVACCSVIEPYYLITEFMQYGDLLGFLRKCREAESEDLDPIYKVGELEQIIIARDIARGMAHIQARNFYHGDLAARNILIGDGLSVKISDFGLADDLYTRGYKRREEEQKIPIKWCSIETILNGICSSQGDVWSFGILLYEVVTLGGSPYPGVAPRFLVTQLRQGYRMEQPDGCPDDIYGLMKRCWHDKSEERPVFSTISEQLADMIEDRTDYFEYEVTGTDEEERYVSTPSQARKNLAPINDEDNAVDIEQLHSVLVAEGDGLIQRNENE